MRCTYVTIPRSVFFVSRLSLTSTSTRIVSPFEHRRYDLHGAAEERHAGAVDEPGLHDQAFAEREGQGAGRGPAAEDRLALDVLHVHEQRLGEAALGSRS
mgnify:CR=1 FL=1